MRFHGMQLVAQRPERFHGMQSVAQRPEGKGYLTPNNFVGTLSMNLIVIFLSKSQTLPFCKPNVGFQKLFHWG